MEGTGDCIRMRYVLSVTRRTGIVYVRRVNDGGGDKVMPVAFEK